MKDSLRNVPFVPSYKNLPTALLYASKEIKNNIKKKKKKKRLERSNIAILLGTFSLVGCKSDSWTAGNQPPHLQRAYLPYKKSSLWVS